MDYRKKIGKFGEDLACQYLSKKGFKILKRNFKISYQELDIIAYQDKITIFIEVKTSISSFQANASDALFAKQIKRLKDAMNIYINKNKLDENFTRMDLIAIDINKHKKRALIKHYPGII